ncbi:LysE family transporter [Azospirillum sp. ST 5-10]|uniref:LysE family transporter n=1 Tax=unclassified Azospirillum TaxID=2630922 RepID=UPI003F4A847C
MTIPSDTAIAVAGILGALTVGAVSPGPSFVLVARTAAAESRRAGLAAALGMGAGGLVFATLALIGLHAVLVRVDWLYGAFKLAGGLYLLHLGVRLWRGAGTPLTVAPVGAPVGTPADGAAQGPAAGTGRPFALGLATQLSNPKTAVVYAGIFAALLPAGAPAWAAAVLLPGVFAIEAGWYAVVAVAFSEARPRAAYLRSKRWVDRAAGAVVGALGARLVADGLTT